MTRRLRRPARWRPFVDALEDRTTPTALVGLTDTGTLITFDSATPATVTKTLTVTGLGGAALVGIDYRPANAQLVGLTTTGLFNIDSTTGAATAVGSFATPLTGTQFGVDFNPAVDKLRVVGNDGQNLRANADTGAIVLVDTPLAYDPASYEAFFGTGVTPTPAPPAPQVVAAAYTKNANPADGKTVTTLYAIDAATEALVIVGGPDSDPSPNTGTLLVVDKLAYDNLPTTGFDIESGTDAAFTVSGNKVYTLNLATAATTFTGTTPANLIGLTVAPPAAGQGTVGLSAAAFSFAAARGALVVPVTRTGGATGAAAVNFATADGTGKAGVDYLPATGTVTFAAGQTTQNIVLAVPAGAGPAAAATFTLTLSGPTNGATLGTAAATITVPAATPTTGGGVFYAVGAGQGGAPTVKVYDAATGAEAFTFAAFEASFTGGVTVATGDVDGDGIDDIILGTGVGGSPRVKIVNGATKATDADFFAYEDSFRGGVNVAAADVTGDGLADVLIGSGVGGRPRVRVIDGGTVSETAPTVYADFFAYEDTFRGGVNVAAGEFTGDGLADIVAGAGFGGGPRVRIFDGGTKTAVADYFAYESTFRNGVRVAAGDVDGNGVTDIIAGSGPGGGPAVREFGGRTETNIQSFFADDAAARGGVNVAAVDRDGDGRDEILAGAGTNRPPVVKLFSGGTEVATFNAFDAGFTGGVFVG